VAEGVSLPKGFHIRMNLMSEKRVILLKLLLDEMYSGLKEYLAALGWEALTVNDVDLQGTGDKDVVEYAGRNELLLVTRDQKTANIADLTGVGCVLISQKDIAKIAAEKIREEYAD
jgi:predicted nuclease of predicted toxin-antitoxin system